jgi:hypothetical protein
MTAARLAVVVALVVLSVAGCNGVKVADGEWASCVGVPSPTSVTVERSASSNAPARDFPPSTNPAGAARLFHDFCVTEGHHDRVKGDVACPAGFGLVYRGSFRHDDATVATFDWAASSCQTLDMTVGGDHAGTDLFGTAAFGARTVRDFRLAVGLKHYGQVFTPGLPGE